MDPKYDTVCDLISSDDYKIYFTVQVNLNQSKKAVFEDIAKQIEEIGNEFDVEDYVTERSETLSDNEIDLEKVDWDFIYIQSDEFSKDLDRSLHQDGEDIKESYVGMVSVLREFIKDMQSRWLIKA